MLVNRRANTSGHTVTKPFMLTFIHYGENQVHQYMHVESRGNGMQ